MVLGSLVWLLVRGIRRYRANGYRRAALSELEALRHGESDATTLSALPELLKRTALGAYPRRDVAALTGASWGRFLESTCPEAGFDAELGEALASVSYRGPETIPASTASRLYAASARWIRGHRAPV